MVIFEITLKLVIGSGKEFLHCFSSPSQRSGSEGIFNFNLISWINSEIVTLRVNSYLFWTKFLLLRDIEHMYVQIAVIICNMEFKLHKLPRSFVSPCICVTNFSIFTFYGPSVCWVIFAVVAFQPFFAFAVHLMPVSIKPEFCVYFGMAQ